MCHFRGRRYIRRKPKGTKGEMTVAFLPAPAQADRLGHEMFYGDAGIRVRLQTRKGLRTEGVILSALKRESIDAVGGFLNCLGRGRELTFDIEHAPPRIHDVSVTSTYVRACIFSFFSRMQIHSHVLYVLYSWSCFPVGSSLHDHLQQAGLRRPGLPQPDGAPPRPLGPAGGVRGARLPGPHGRGARGLRHPGHALQRCAPQDAAGAGERAGGPRALLPAARQRGVAPDQGHPRRGRRPARAPRAPRNGAPRSAPSLRRQRAPRRVRAGRRRHGHHHPPRRTELALAPRRAAAPPGGAA